MRFVLFVILAALTAYFAFGGNSSAIAGTDTPSATPSPSPTPSPTAVGSGTPTGSPTPAPGDVVGVKFVQDGRRVSVETGSALYRVFADGAECGQDYEVPQVPALTSGWGDTWPSQHLVAGAPAACRKPPPTTIRVEFAARERLTPEFVWTGGSQTLDFEIPAPRIDVLTVRFVKAGRPVAINKNFVGVTPEMTGCMESQVGSLDAPIGEVPVSLSPWTGCELQPGQTIELSIRTLPQTFTGSLIWAGGDMTTVVEVPDSVPTTELPATATPAFLPITGGPPSASDAPPYTAGLAAVFLAVTIVIVVRRARA